MKNKRGWLVTGLAVVAVVLAGVAGVLWSLPRFEVVNNLSLQKFRLSTLGGGIFLWKSGYITQVNRVKVVYTDQKQPGYALYGGGDEPALTMYMEKTGRAVTVYIQYGPQHFEEISQKAKWFDNDIYVGVCLAIEGKQLGWKGCQEKSAKYLQWLSGKNVPEVVQKGASLLQRLRFVQQAFAQVCWGEIKCGQEVWQCDCTNIVGIETCSNDAFCGGTPGSCACGNVCRLDLGSVLNCGSLSNQSVCEAASPAYCAIGCNPDASNPCSWYPVGVPTPTPVGGGGGEAGAANFSVVLYYDLNGNGIADNPPTDLLVNTNPAISGSWGGPPWFEINGMSTYRSGITRKWRRGRPAWFGKGPTHPTTPTTSMLVPRLGRMPLWSKAVFPELAAGTDHPGYLRFPLHPPFRHGQMVN